MTREEAITALGDRNNLLWGMSKEEQEYYSKALDMAISALSAEGEYIKKEDALNKVEELKKIHFDRVVVLNKVSDGLNGLLTYSIPSPDIEDYNYNLGYNVGFTDGVIKGNSVDLEMIKVVHGLRK